jgi:uncharacterized protein (DUF608 family)
MESKTAASLFPQDTPTREWATFPAAGYAAPVAGMIFQPEHGPTNGVPLGGVDTGCLDLEADGTFGLCTIFNSHMPRRGPLGEPFLGLNVDNRTWILTTRKPANVIPWAPNDVLEHERYADDIRYWGHYPVVDMQFTTTAPVSAALRAWTPFIPGDLPASNTPAAVFELHLRNDADVHKTGTVAFTFPGPTEYEGGSLPLRRRYMRDRGFNGIEVSGSQAGYVLAVIGDEQVRTGGGLGCDAGAWCRIHKGLPTALGAPGASVAVNFALEPGEERVIRFLLAWYSPVWYGGGSPDPLVRYSLPWYEREAQLNGLGDGRGNPYTHMYAGRFGNAVDVAAAVARDHAALLGRIIAWQQVIYDDASLPVWLRDSLVNNFHMITETGFWAMAKPPIGEWCKPEDGLFGMNEDPRHCPQIECLPCSYYGNYPVVLFFPQLALSTLRGYKAYQFADGQPTWIFGGMTDTPPSGPCEMATPTRGYQASLNGDSVVDMVYRYWVATRDDAVLREMYDFCKRATAWTIGLRKEDGADDIISFPTGNVGLEWFEACTWAGMAAHVGGLHLAQIREVQDMAERLGDAAFAAQCREWLAQGSNSMETKMWAGDYYLNYWEPSTGKRSDLVMANQLDGDWQMYLAGLPPVFDPQRGKLALETIKQACVTPTPYGAVNFATRDGRPTTSGEGNPGWNYNPYAYFPPEVLMLGMTYMYTGQREFGLELCRRCWANIIESGLGWDMPNIIHGETGARIYGGDYYQDMMLWALPAALAGTDLGGPCKQGGLVERVIRAGKA